MRLQDVLDYSGDGQVREVDVDKSSLLFRRLVQNSVKDRLVDDDQLFQRKQRHLGILPVVAVRLEAAQFLSQVLKSRFNSISDELLQVLLTAN